MAEEQFAAQDPLAELFEHDPAFASWANTAMESPRVPLTLAAWDQGEPPRELALLQEMAASQTVRLAQVIDEIGWPGRSLVGEDGADAAWAIAQHGDRHNRARAGWLALLEEAASVGEADPRHLARLTDRVAMVAGGNQSYGTYAQLDEDGNIEWAFPVEGTLAEVDARRGAIGLPTLAADLAEPVGAAPYRELRMTPAFAWPHRRT